MTGAENRFEIVAEIVADSLLLLNKATKGSPFQKTCGFLVRVPILDRNSPQPTS